MLGRNSYRVSDGGDVDLLGPLDKFNGMDGKQSVLSAIEFNINCFGMVNEPCDLFYLSRNYTA